jgi:AhpD family alkylhydroperoxidase
MSERLAHGQTFPELRDAIKPHLRTFRKRRPEVMKAYAELHAAAGETGALDKKIKELIALTTSVALHCDDCIAFHTHDALRAGATEDEILDAMSVSVLMGGGPALMYVAHVIEAMEEFEQKLGLAGG